MLSILWRRRRIALAAGLLVIATVTFVTLQLPNVYTATSYLLVVPEGPRGSDFETAHVSETLTKTYGKLLGTPAIERRVQARLRSELGVGDLTDAINIKIDDSQILAIEAEGDTARQAQLIANTYADVFVERSARFARSPTGAQVSVAEYAITPAERSRPRPKLYLAIGGFLAAFAALGAALLYHRLDQRLELDALDETEVLGLPVLARIPQTAVLSRARPAGAGPPAPDDLGPGLLEGFRLLFASLLFSDHGDRPETLAIVSASEKEGKTTTAIYVARAAAESGVRTALVDADLRRPSLLDKLGMLEVACPVGLSTLLTMPGTMVNSVQLRTDHENLTVIPAGPSHANPAALLSGELFADVDRRLRTMFDFIVYDTPPLVIAADGHVVAARAAGVVLVLDATSTRRTAVVTAVTQLRRARASLLGVVINRARQSADSSYYYPQASPPRDAESGLRKPAAVRSR